ncbi:MAG: barstar family protein [Pseudomonadota bacterium]
MPRLEDILAQPSLNGVYRLLTPAELVPVLDGTTLAGKVELLAGIGRALDFPDYYGGNWDALEECLSDLSWRAGPVHLLIRHADAIPAEHLGMLLDIFTEAAGHWARLGRVCSLFLEGLASGELAEAS